MSPPGARRVVMRLTGFLLAVAAVGFGLLMRERATDRGSTPQELAMIQPTYPPDMSRPNNPGATELLRNLAHQRDKVAGCLQSQLSTGRSLLVQVRADWAALTHLPRLHAVIGTGHRVAEQCIEERLSGVLARSDGKAFRPQAAFSVTIAYAFPEPNAGVRARLLETCRDSRECRARCSEGSAASCLALGMHYLQRNQPPATTYLQRACRLGEPDACVMLVDKTYRRAAASTGSCDPNDPLCGL